jgi:hypothetical protein
VNFSLSFSVPVCPGVTVLEQLNGLWWNFILWSLLKFCQFVSFWLKSDHYNRKLHRDKCVFMHFSHY